MRYAHVALNLRNMAVCSFACLRAIITKRLSNPSKGQSMQGVVEASVLYVALRGSQPGSKPWTLNPCSTGCLDRLCAERFRDKLVGQEFQLLCPCVRLRDGEVQIYLKSISPHGVAKIFTSIFLSA